MNIDTKKEYKPKEIIDNDWILNSKGKADYWYLLKLIKSGELKARDYCKTDKYWFLISGKEIQRYINKPKKYKKFNLTKSDALLF